MKFVHNNISKLLHTHIFSFGVFAVMVAFFIFAGGFVVANSQTLEPTDRHIVSLYINGQETTVPTRAQTVGDFLKRMDIKTHPDDLVEPAVKTTIDSDNFRVHVYKAKPVTINDGSSSTKMLSPYSDPTTIAKKAGYTIYPEDNIKTHTTGSFVKAGSIGTVLTIDRATKIIVSLYGSPLTIDRTQATTVGEYLKENKIIPEEGSNIIPSKSTPITEGMTIFVAKAGKTVIVVEEEIPFENIYKVDANKPIGYKQVTKAGVKGKKIAVYEANKTDTQNGRTLLQEIVTLAPQGEELVVGSKTAAFAGDFAAALAKLRSCEGAYTSNTGNGYYGAYQFNLGTWRANAPAGYGGMLPNNAPPQIQDQAAATLYQRRGWQPWPSCSRSLGLLDIYR
jgi:uncharacterized protein YabE (DUF348 family)